MSNVSEYMCAIENKNEIHVFDQFYYIGLSVTDLINSLTQSCINRNPAMRSVCQNLEKQTNKKNAQINEGSVFDASTMDHNVGHGLPWHLKTTTPMHVGSQCPLVAWLPDMHGQHSKSAKGQTIISAKVARLLLATHTHTIPHHHAISRHHNCL